MVWLYSFRRRLVVRRNDATAPITVYDFYGHQLQVLGKDVKGMAYDRAPGSYYYDQGIAIDTKRDLYLLPMVDGSLVTLDMNGTVKDRMNVTDYSLCGVSYSDQDMYITCSYYVCTKCVHKTDPNTKLTCTLFTPTTKFRFPCHVSSGQYDTGGGMKPVVIVSDWYCQCIKLLDYSGNLLHTYGNELNAGHGSGELDTPWGVCMGPGGRVIVCDHGNNRVVSFYRTENKHGWEVLLDKDKLSGQGFLYYVACGHRSRNLFVGYDSGDITVFEG